MAIKPYLDKVGLTNLWANVKAYVTSKVPTKNSQLSNDTDYATRANVTDSLQEAKNYTNTTTSNMVTTNTSQTISGTKTFSGDISGTKATFTDTAISAKVQATVDLGLILANKDSKAPTTTSGWNQVQFYDKNMVQLGYFQFSSNTNGNVYNWVGRKNSNLTVGRMIHWNVDADIFCCSPNSTVSLGSSTNKWGQLHCTEITTYSANFHRNIFGNYGTFWRQDGEELYLMVTARGNPTGNWTEARPIKVNLATGLCYINGHLV